MLPKKPLPVALVILFDLLGIGAMLLVFVLFHHILRLDSSAPLQNIVFHQTPTPAAEEADAPTAFTAAESSVTPEISPTPEPTPTPEPGDFSATFPSDEPVDEENVVGSHITDNLRLVVTEEHSDDATYFVADVWIRNIREFKTAMSRDTFGRGYYSMPNNMAADHNAVLALSGDCYGARTQGIVIRNGALYRDTVSGDVCILYADGVMETYYESEFSIDDAVARGAYQGWSFGPKLIDNGAVPEDFNTTAAIIAHNPRSAIGYYEPGHYCLVTVDGRQSGYSRGMTLTELSELFLSLGCVDAYNLDGGQSAMMTFDGNIVNQPYHGGRAISDIIYFGGDDVV
jgi:exopolysaccharide biosynthesis protein